MTQLIGWAASAVLVCTIGSQVFKQWHDDTSKGVSLYLFLGQILANGLFLTYASLTGDVVFIVANALLLVTSLVGLAIKYRHQQRGESPSTAEAQ